MDEKVNPKFFGSGGFMSEKEIKKLVSEMKKFSKKDETPQEAREFLVRAGICDTNGKLRKIYQS